MVRPTSQTSASVLGVVRSRVIWISSMSRTCGRGRAPLHQEQLDPLAGSVRDLDRTGEGRVAVVEVLDRFDSRLLVLHEGLEVVDVEAALDAVADDLADDAG